MNRGHKCTYNKQIREELFDDAVAEVIIKLVSNPKFVSMIQEKINMKVDTSAIENEIDNYQKELRKSHSTKFKLIEEIDALDVEDKHYKRRKNDLDDRLYRMYDKIEELEGQLIEAKAKKETIETEKLTGDNIYKVLIYFDKLYKTLNDVERRQLIETLISEIQIYEYKQPNGQWLKSITFKLPIIDEDLNISLDNNEQVEAVVLLSKLDVDKHIDVEINLDELDLTSAESKATYAQIKEYILEKFDLKVSILYIAIPKKKCGIVLRDNYNKSKKEKQIIPQCTPEKEEAITDVLRHFKMI